MSRGLYRGIFTSLVDDPDFQTLMPNSKLVFYTARLCQQAGAAAIFRYYPEMLVKQTGLTARQVECALQELEHDNWIVREGVILWVRNGLRYDPSLTLANPKHRASVEKALKGLPKLNIVLRFCDYYKIGYPFDRDSVHGLLNPNPSPKTESESEADLTTLSGSVPDAASVNSNGHPRREQAHEILAWLNDKAGTRFEAIPTNLDLIEARLKEGRPAWLLKKLVSVKAKAWPRGHEMHEFLRPATLFNRTKCAQYIGQLPVGAGEGEPS